MPAPHATVPCKFCGKPVHPGQVGTWGRGSGWGQYRADGGWNGWALREEHGEFAHNLCIDLAKRGHRIGQTSLDEAAPAEEREAIVDDALPIFDGTQTGMTAVACPHCDYCGLADKLPHHLKTRHADVD